MHTQRYLTEIQAYPCPSVKIELKTERPERAWRRKGYENLSLETLGLVITIDFEVAPLWAMHTQRYLTEVQAYPYPLKIELRPERPESAWRRKGYENLSVETLGLVITIDF